MKKTVSILNLIETVNNANRTNTASPDFRTGMNVMLEGILHDAGVYAGYGNYTQRDVPAGQLPGMRWDTVNGEWTAGANSIHDETVDDSRRFYYAHRKLTTKK